MDWSRGRTTSRALTKVAIMRETKTSQNRIPRELPDAGGSLRVALAVSLLSEPTVGLRVTGGETADDMGEDGGREEGCRGRML